MRQCAQAKGRKELLVAPTKMLLLPFSYFAFSFVLKSKYNAYFRLFGKTKIAKEIGASQDF